VLIPRAARDPIENGVEQAFRPALKLLFVAASDAEVNLGTRKEDYLSG